MTKRIICVLVSFLFCLPSHAWWFPSLFPWQTPSTPSSTPVNPNAQAQTIDYVGVGQTVSSTKVTASPSFGISLDGNNIWEVNTKGEYLFQAIPFLPYDLSVRLKQNLEKRCFEVQVTYTKSAENTPVKWELEPQFTLGCGTTIFEAEYAFLKGSVTLPATNFGALVGLTSTFAYTVAVKPKIQLDVGTISRSFYEQPNAWLHYLFPSRGGHISQSTSAMQRHFDLVGAMEPGFFSAISVRTPGAARIIGNVKISNNLSLTTATAANLLSAEGSVNPGEIDVSVDIIGLNVGQINYEATDGKIYSRSVAGVGSVNASATVMFLTEPSLKFQAANGWLYYTLRPDIAYMGLFGQKLPALQYQLLPSVYYSKA